MKDAIREIVAIMDMFPDIFKISIASENHITVHYTDTEFHEKTFEDTVELLEWCEQNLDNA